MFSGNISLNSYQQLMLKLSHLSPYNAVHSVLINDANACVPLLERSINAVIKQLGIGTPELSPNLQSVVFAPLASPITFETRLLSLEQHIENEMNYLFPVDAFPLRFFIISHESQLYFSITYNHWIGDAYSISKLMGAIFNHIDGQTSSALTMDAPDLEDCFKHIYKKKTLYYRYLGAMRIFLQFSRVFRTEVNNIECTASGCYSHFFSKDVLQQLIALCKAQNITLNDLFVTVLAKIFGRVTQVKRGNIKSKWLKPKRDQIMIGVISNIRERSRQSLSNTFGLFLGFFYLSLNAPEQSSFSTLSQIISAKTKRLKHKNAAIKQYLLFQIQKNWWDRTKKTRSKYRLFSKNTPITVGISNMNLNGSDNALLNNVNQYIRFSPTAMVCPIVFNITTLNGCMSLGINFRKSCYTPVEAEIIRDEFVMEINALINPCFIRSQTTT